MCVAAVIESTDPVSDDDLKKMADANPDGGGVAWVDGDSVHYRKGLTWQDVSKIQAYLPRPYFLHFRIATKGGKCPELTHPFPIGVQAFSEDLTGMARAVVMHNGTWGKYDSYIPEGINRHAVSDTQIAAYVAAWDESILDEVSWSNAIMRAAGKGRADITLRGQWSEYGGKGNMFSNTHWTHRTVWTGRTWSYGDAVTPSGPAYSYEEWAKRKEERDAISRGAAMTRGAAMERARAAIKERDEKAAKKARKDAKRARREARLKARCKGESVACQLSLDPADENETYNCDQCGATQGHYSGCIARLPARTAAQMRGVETMDLVEVLEATEKKGLHLVEDWDEIDATIRAQGIKL